MYLYFITADFARKRFIKTRDVARTLSLGGGLKPMASAEREPITGVWGQSPQRGPGAEPLVGGQGGKAPLKLKAYQSLDVERRPQICPFLAFWEVD